MPKILITSRSFCSMGHEAEDMLKEQGHQVEYYQDTYNEDIFCEKLCTCDGLIIGGHPLSEKALKQAPHLKVVVKHGTGLDNIDLRLTETYHIAVDRVPAANANAVADLTFGLLLDTARHISCAALQVKQGMWNVMKGIDVYNKTLSLIGFGQIGQCVARRAKGFSMSVLIYDPFMDQLTDEFSSYAKRASFEEALAGADFLSIHVPLGPNTKNLIASSQLALMKPDAILVNTSRGGIVNEAALHSALTSGALAGAGLDVLDQEPASPDNPLCKLPQVTILPHMGMYSKEAINAVSTAAAAKIIEYFR